jgi:hypothetical protein
MVFVKQQTLSTAEEFSYRANADDIRVLELSEMTARDVLLVYKLLLISFKRLVRYHNPPPCIVNRK